MCIGMETGPKPLLAELYIAPGNGGTDNYGINVEIPPMDFDAVGDFVASHAVNMVVCGNEDPLVGGIREALLLRFPSLLVVGPDSGAPRSKVPKITPRLSWPNTASRRPHTELLTPLPSPKVKIFGQPATSLRAQG